MKDLVKLLEKSERINGYRISEKTTKSHELFFVHRNLETVRVTDTVSASVTVYVDHDGKRGDSTFSVYASMSDEDIEKKIETAAFRASLVSNEPYQLPEGDTLDAALPTNLDACDVKELGAKIAKAVYDAESIEGGSINALEIFIYRDEIRVRNSRGVDKKQTVNRVMIEAIPTFTTDKESVELYEDHRFTEFDAAKVTAEISEKMKEVEGRSKAVKPETPLDVNVILRPHEISELISELAYDLNYASVYSHANLHKIGDDLQSGEGHDKLNVTMKAVIEGSERSAYFDDDGTSLTDTCIIKDGVVNAYFGSHRFGQYLGVEKPSGSLRCGAVAPGTLTEEEIKSEPYIECVSMSGLQLDLYNDYIGGEIRLAYYFNGKTKYPVTGITMSAKLSDVLGNLRLSEKTEVSGAYEGPSRLLMKKVSVL